ncbi:uncharacterized protein LOC123037336 [Drosophila rhopaloa]|uniref:Uncharacterized protein n=1 Tax=Drosophila rhopaloa TaxID=1041015 RepID=A0ABM5J3J7_DRORH|nr:uncharacterized protein LOC123037336 [Drosophila rhopaloa]
MATRRNHWEHWGSVPGEIRMQFQTVPCAGPTLTKYCLCFLLRSFNLCSLFHAFHVAVAYHRRSQAKRLPEVNSKIGLLLQTPCGLRTGISGQARPTPRPAPCNLCPAGWQARSRVQQTSQLLGQDSDFGVWPGILRRTALHSGNYFPSSGLTFSEPISGLLNFPRHQHLLLRGALVWTYPSRPRIAKPTVFRAIRTFRRHGSWPSTSVAEQAPFCCRTVPEPVVYGSAIPAARSERIPGLGPQVIHLQPIRILLRLRKHGLVHSGFFAGTKARLLPVRGESLSSEVVFDFDALVPQLVHRERPAAAPAAGVRASSHARFGDLGTGPSVRHETGTTDPPCYAGLGPSSHVKVPEHLCPRALVLPLQELHSEDEVLHRVAVVLAVEGHSPSNYPDLLAAKVLPHVGIYMRFLAAIDSSAVLDVLALRTGGVSPR